ncbi:class I SAM-dependent methyltransferase [Omnitrophica bacterium]|nr:class I SAM-dependent methyltransferase [Candidatus Omnitrophota bacterium]
MKGVMSPAGCKKMGCKTRVPGDLTGILSGYLVKKRIYAALPYLEGKKRILDIGCGIFRWGDLLPAGSEYIGLDHERAIVEYNQERFPYTFFNMDVEKDDLSRCGKGFDLIIMLAVIEHFKSPYAVMERLKGLLAPQGIIVLTTPHPISTLVLDCGARFKLFARDKHTHRDLLGRDALNGLTDSCGFRLNKYKRFLLGFNQLAVLNKREDER